MSRPSSKPTNLTELARLLGVSRTLVSQVANHHSGVAIKPETRARILAAIEEHQLTPVRPRAVREICVIEPPPGFEDQAPFVQPPYFNERINLGIRRAASQAGYALSFVAVEGSDWSRRVEERLPALSGVLAVGQPGEALLQRAQAQAVPLVLIDSHDPSGRFDSVERDHAGMIRISVETLVRGGAREIAFLNPRGEGAELRHFLFQQHLAAVGLPSRAERVVDCIGHLQGGQDAMEQLLESGEPFDAVLAGGEYALAGALFALRAAERQIPGQVQLLALGGDSICHSLSPTLANVDAGAIAMGERAVRLLLQRIASPGGDPERILIRPIYTPGQSVLPTAL